MNQVGTQSSDIASADAATAIASDIEKPKKSFPKKKGQYTVREMDAMGLNRHGKPKSLTVGKNKNIPLDKIKALKDKGLSNQQVADLVGCSRSNVAQRMEQWKEEFKTVDFYRENKLAILDSLQYKILCSISNDDLKRMALRDRITAYGILFDKSRITAGDDVVKLDIRLLHGDLEEITRKKEELKSKLMSMTIGSVVGAQL